MECKQNYLLVCAIKWAESTGINLRTEPYTPALADACSYISDLRRQLAVHLEPILSFPSSGEEQQCLLMVCRKSQTPCEIQFTRYNFVTLVYLEHRVLSISRLMLMCPPPKVGVHHPTHAKSV